MDPKVTQYGENVIHAQKNIDDLEAAALDAIYIKYTNANFPKIARVMDERKGVMDAIHEYFETRRKKTDRELAP